MANEPRFETHPQRYPDDDVHMPGEVMPNIFYWHFRDANGKVTANGGEGFSGRHNAHRAIATTIEDFVGAAGLGELNLAAEWKTKIPIVDFDEQGKPIG